MKVAVIGGGSSYTPELVAGLLARRDVLPLTELWLMDVSAVRLDIVGGFVRRQVESRQDPFAVHLTTERREAVRGARYVITQLRVGGMQARRGDEYLGRRHGLIGQETTGVGGMANALRTIPAILQIACDMSELAPGSLLVNFANPSGLIAEALARYAPTVPSVGVCNVAVTTQMEILAGLGNDLGTTMRLGQTSLDTLGLNHLSWHRGFVADGQDHWPRILERFLVRLHGSSDPEWDPRTIESLGMIPNHYLRYYYYTDRELALQARWPPSRAEEVMEIEQALLSEYADGRRAALPASLTRRGGAHYSTVATQLLNAHHNDLGETHVVNVPHRGAVPGWPEAWVLEMPCCVGADGLHPLPTEPLPPVCFGLLAQVKMFEILTVEAAVHGDRKAAYQALLAHPLGPTADRVDEVLDDMLESNKEHLARFWF
jgi:6-phospho-beta-glucosidase